MLTWHSVSLPHTWITEQSPAFSPFVLWICSAWSLICWFDFGFCWLTFLGISWCSPPFSWSSQLAPHNFSCTFLACWSPDWIWIVHHQAVSLASSHGRARTCGLSSVLFQFLQAFCRSSRSGYRAAQSCTVHTLTSAVDPGCPLWPCLRPLIWLTRRIGHPPAADTCLGPSYAFSFRWQTCRYPFAAARNQSQDLRGVLSRNFAPAATFNLSVRFSDSLEMTIEF